MLLNALACLPSAVKSRVLSFFLRFSGEGSPTATPRALRRTPERSLLSFARAVMQGLPPTSHACRAPDSCGGQEVLCTPRHLDVHIRKRSLLSLALSLRLSPSPSSTRRGGTKTPPPRSRRPLYCVGSNYAIHKQKQAQSEAKSPPATNHKE